MRRAGGQLLSAILVLATAAVVTSAVFGEHGVTHLVRLRAERQELARIAFTLLQENARLHEEIRRLRVDDLYLEEVARQQLGLVRPNETVYRFRRPAG